MKIEINIEDFWLDQESELEPALKQHIINTAVHKISDSIKEKTEKAIESAVKKTILESIDKQVQDIIENFIKEGKMKESSYSDAKMISVEDYIQKMFNEKNGWGNPSSKIEEAAKRMGEELKKRYDLLFATQIVKKIGENGMLKDDVAKLLLEQNS